MHPLNGVLPGPYVPVRVRPRIGLDTGLASAVSQCGLDPVRVDLANPVFDGVGLAGFKSRANASLLA